VVRLVYEGGIEQRRQVATVLGDVPQDGVVQIEFLGRAFLGVQLRPAFLQLCQLVLVAAVRV